MFRRSQSKKSEPGTPNSPSLSGSGFSIWSKRSLSASVIDEGTLQAFKQTVQSAGIEDSYVTDELLGKVLKARNGNIDAALVMLQNLIAWRQEYHPENINEDAVAEFLKKGVLEFAGADKEGRPILLIRGRNHIPKAAEIAQNLKGVVYAFEKSTSESNKAADGYMNIILDQKDMARKNVDIALITSQPGLLQILQCYYPETLRMAVVIHPTWIFKMMWAIVSPFMDERTRSKVHVVYRIEDLTQFFDFEKLPAEYQEQILEKKPSLKVKAG